MHVAFWSPAWPLAHFQNGIITYVHWMKLELEKLGHRVSIFTADMPASHSEPRVYRVDRPRWHGRIARLFGGGSQDPDGIFAYASVIATHVARVHRQDPIDVMEMEESFGWFADVGARTNIPLAVKLHGPAFLSMVEDELATPFAAVKLRREGSALQQSKTIVSPSALTLKQTLERYQLSPAETRVIVNPIAMDSATPHWELAACDHNSILFVGRFDLRKGADIVLKAFATLLETRPTLRLVFVGPDRGIRAEDGRLLHFKEYAATLLSQEQLQQIDFRGPLPNAEVARLRTRAMVTLVASRWENQGYTLLEAMYQGCPVVSTDAGGCPESIEHEVTGRLAQSANPGDFATQLGAILDNPEAAARMGQAARRSVIDQHSTVRIAMQSMDLYKHVIATNRR